MHDLARVFGTVGVILAKVDGNANPAHQPVKQLR